MPSPNLANPPIIFANDLLPDHYRVLEQAVHCTACHNTIMTCESFSVSRLPFGGNPWRLTPVTSFEYNIPIHKETLLPRKVPCCSLCLAQGRVLTSHLPPLTSHPQWEATLARKRLEAERASTTKPAKPTKPTPTKPTLEDLL